MVSFYGVFSQQWLSRLPLGPPCTLKIDTSRSWGQHEFSSISSMEGGWSYSCNRAWWPIVYGTPLPIQAWRTKFGVLKRSIRTVGRGIRRAVFLKGNGKLPLCQKQILHLGIYTKDGPTRRKDGSAILATRSRREWKRNWVWSSHAKKGKGDLIPTEKL